ncbi:MAG TPA: serine--tRNA ligase [Candidatus Parcubacteria bacterium]|nr:serine--tRNA ligase [Candidatus Parcubacteria bacterium]
MLDIKFIRENPEKIKKGCLAKGVKVDINHLLDIDKKRRKIIQEIDLLRARKNKVNREIIAIKEKEKKEKLVKEMQKNKDKEKGLADALKRLDKEFEAIMGQLPNLPGSDVPAGRDERDNIVLRRIGEKPSFSFPPRDYLKIGEELDIIDVKRAAKTSGSRFSFLKREAVLMEFALINFVLDNLVKEGFIPVIPPVMLRSRMARGTGYLESTDIEEAYYLPKDDLFLVGTSEQSLLTMHADEVFSEKDLPRRYVGFSTCFRREAGSYGKDTRGILRVHQFDKLEMFSFSQPENSENELQFILSLEEKLMKKLKIPYQVINICAGDLGLPAAKKYDIEAWIQSENRYRETHSCSNCTDFQSRRLNIRYKDRKGEIKFVHTLNGTGLAIGRTLIAIIENYQQRDGSIKVPQVLRKYLGGNKKIPWLKRK